MSEIKVSQERIDNFEKLIGEKGEVSGYKVEIIDIEAAEYNFVKYECLDQDGPEEPFVDILEKIKFETPYQNNLKEEALLSPVFTET